MKTHEYVFNGGKVTNVTDFPIWPNYDARFSLTQMPGCESVLISHGAEVQEHKRGQGIGQAAHVERLRIARDDHAANYMLCTVNADNKAQIAILRKNGWKKLDSFVHSCTLHKIHIYGRSIYSQGCS